MGETTYTFDDGYSIKLVTDMDHFNGLRETWDSLLTNYSSHVPFLCFDWFKIWLKHFLKDNRLLVLLLFKGNSIVAIAPFLVRSESFKGIIRARKVSLIGNHHSPIKNFIFNDLSIETRTDCLIHILSFFRDEFKEWDVMDLDSIPEEDHSFDVLKRAANGIELKQREYFCFNDWVLDEISYSGEDYISRMPKSLRKELGKRKRRLQRKGDLKFEIGTDKQALDYYLRVYYEVRKKSWKHREADAAFLNEFRKFAMGKGWLRFAILFSDRSPISCHLRLTYKNIVYFVESVYDLEYKKFSPTTILRSELIKYVIDKENAAIVHTIKGDEPYKRDWTPTRRERIGISVFNNNTKGWILGLLMTKALPIFNRFEILTELKRRLSNKLERSQMGAT